MLNNKPVLEIPLAGLWFYSARPSLSQAARGQMSDRVPVRALTGIVSGEEFDL
jgi:hypothetical protein